MSDVSVPASSRGRLRAVDRALLVKVVTVLLVNGQTSEGTRIALARLGRALGHDVGFSAAWGASTIRIDDCQTAVHVSAEPSGVDIGRVIATERLIDGVGEGRLSASDALAAMRAAERSPPVSLVRLALMAAAGASALGVISGAPNLLTLGLIAVFAGAGACLRRALSQCSGNPFLQPFAAALLAGIGGGVVSMLGLDVSHHLIVVCPCMVLMPGPHFLNGMIDLVRARIPIGAARTVFATLIVLAICAGLLTGLFLTGNPFPGSDVKPPVPLIRDIGAAGIAVAAYGSFFNMPWRILPGPIGIGLLAHALMWELLQHGASLQLSTLGACTLVGIVVTPFARRFRMPFGACAFASIVSLMPGVVMFQAASDAVSLVNIGGKNSLDHLLVMMENFTTAALIIFAMAVGLILPKMVFDALVLNDTGQKAPDYI